MAQCPNCGARVSDAVHQCPNCGGAVEGGGHPPGQRQHGQAQGGQSPPDGTLPGEQQPGQPHGAAPRPEGAPARSGESGGGLSRRQVLAGAGVAGVAAVGGGWYLFARGPSGASAVADEYVTAVGENDWEQAVDLFHDEAPPVRQIESDNGIDDYEAYLQGEEKLDGLEEFDPTIVRHVEWNHYTEIDERAVEDLPVDGQIDPDDVEAIKQISTVVEGDVSVMNEETEEYFAGETTRGAFYSTVVRAGESWSLWTVSHPVR